jgi:hypothetical protein
MAQVTAARTSKKQWIQKVEVTYGTDAIAGTYQATDVMSVISTTIRTTPEIERFPNLATQGALGRGPATIGRTIARMAATMAVRGKGTAYSASNRPECDLLLRGSGLAATVVTTGGSESVTYQPSDTHESQTIYSMDPIPGSANGLSKQLVGAHGNVVLRGLAGLRTDLNIDYQGVLEEMADITAVAGSFTATPSWPTLKSAAFQIGGANYAPCIAEFEFNMGNQLIRVPCANATRGEQGFMILDRDPTLVFVAQTGLEANSGFWAALIAGTLLDCTFQLGTTQYNRLRFQYGAGGSNALQVVNIEEEDREGISYSRVTCVPTISGSGNNDFSLVFD